MVDVGAKAVTAREAVASGHIALSAATRRAVRAGRLKKGDPLQAARLAGIMAAKRTSDVIPLCHPLVLTGIDVELTHTARGIAIRAAVRTAGQTGVEMEALTAVSVAALTVYDMLKAIDKGMVIERVQLEEKTGGQSGHYRRRAARPARRAR
jgi:cyclic pyranopterin phosphate synthase